MNVLYSTCYILIIIIEKMGCVGEKGDKKHREQNPLDSVTKKICEDQITLLKQLYSDLGSRISEKQLNLQNFLLFFHKNGYWGDRLFKQFDSDASNLISETQFIKGILKICKTSEDVKIELLYKFFSNNKTSQGISFSSFLTMLYNYPKEDFKNIIDDNQFIQKELKGNLIALNTDISGRRLVSVCPNDMRNNMLMGTKFALEQSDKTSDKLESRVGANIIQELNRNVNNKGAVITLKVGENDVEIKTTSIQHLAKKYAKAVFKSYQINEERGKFKFEQFMDWIKKHRNLYKDYYNGFHNDVWEIQESTGKPLYKSRPSEFESQAKMHIFNGKTIKIVLSLIKSILIVTDQDSPNLPCMLISLEGLAVKKYYTESKGYGIEICHRDGIYPSKIFTFLSDKLQEEWMQYLKYYKGASISQLYDMGDKIGIGKFSVVYKCTQKSSGEQYAIKVIETYKLDDQAKKLIAHQSSIMSVLSHPLLVYFKESIQTKTHIYIITELVKGKDLFELVKQLRFFGEEEAAYIVQQAIIGVRYIHSLGMVHRDLKPQNIMVEYDEQKGEVGRIKLIDFGFTNYLSKLRQLSPQQLWAGTPNYIAPEILRQQPISQKVDNFAIGSILYFTLSGNLPFNSYDLNGILQKTIEGSYVLNDKRWKNISENAKDLVARLLENDPQDRITLDQALKHPWFDQVRNKKSLKLSMHFTKSPTAHKGNAVLY